MTLSGVAASICAGFQPAYWLKTGAVPGVNHAVELRRAEAGRLEVLLGSGARYVKMVRVSADARNRAVEQRLRRPYGGGGDGAR